MWQLQGSVKDYVIKSNVAVMREKFSGMFCCSWFLNLLHIILLLLLGCTFYQQEDTLAIGVKEWPYLIVPRLKRIRNRDSNDITNQEFLQTTNWASRVKISSIHVVSAQLGMGVSLKRFIWSLWNFILTLFNSLLKIMTSDKTGTWRNFVLPWPAATCIPHPKSSDANVAQNKRRSRTELSPQKLSLATPHGSPREFCNASATVS